MSSYNTKEFQAIVKIAFGTLAAFGSVTIVTWLMLFVVSFS
jgi:hypothetical protein